MKDATIVLDVFRQYHQVSTASMFESWVQMLHELRSTSSLDDIPWAAEAAFDVKRKVADRSIYHVLIWRYLSRMHTAYLVGAYELAETCGNIIALYAHEDMNFNSVTMSLFLRGLVAIARYRTTKRRKYKRVVQSVLKQFQNWSSIGSGVNLLHRSHLLSAEWASANERASKSQYDMAIYTATRAGFLGDAALANELAALSG